MKILYGEGYYEGRQSYMWEKVSGFLAGVIFMLIVLRLAGFI